MSKSDKPDEPWRVEPDPTSKMFPWRCVGPEGLESGHQDEKGAKREARKYNRVYAMGVAAQRPPSAATEMPAGYIEECEAAVSYLSSLLHDVEYDRNNWRERVHDFSQNGLGMDFTRFTAQRTESAPMCHRSLIVAARNVIYADRKSALTTDLIDALSRAADKSAEDILQAQRAEVSAKVPHEYPLLDKMRTWILERRNSTPIAAEKEAWESLWNKANAAIGELIAEDARRRDGQEDAVT